jgi:hypothetical protein
MSDDDRLNLTALLELFGRHFVMACTDQRGLSPRPSFALTGSFWLLKGGGRIYRPPDWRVRSFLSHSTAIRFARRFFNGLLVADQEVGERGDLDMHRRRAVMTRLPTARDLQHTKIRLGVFF